MKVLLVDDHHLVVAGLRQLLSSYSDIVIVGAAESGTNAIQMAMETDPDVVLMDVWMDGIDGIDATRAIKRLAPRCAVIMLSSSDDVDDIVSSLDAGADGYILKDAEPDELVDSIRRCLAGEMPLSPAVRERLGEHGRWPGGPPHLELTRRESQVLRLIAEGRSNSDIAHALGISDKTVRSHCSSLFAQLGVTSRTQAAMWVASQLGATVERPGRAAGPGRAVSRGRDIA